MAASFDIQIATNAAADFVSDETPALPTRDVWKAFQRLHDCIDGLVFYRAQLGWRAQRAFDQLRFAIEAEFDLFDQNVNKFTGFHPGAENVDWRLVELTTQKLCGAHHGRYLDCLGILQDGLDAIRISLDTSDESVLTNPVHGAATALDTRTLYKLTLAICSAQGAFEATLETHMFAIQKANDTLRVLDAQELDNIPKEELQRLEVMQELAQRAADVLGESHGFSCGCRHEHVAYFCITEDLVGEKRNKHVSHAGPHCSIMFHNTSSGNDQKWAVTSVKVQALPANAASQDRTQSTTQPPTTRPSISSYSTTKKPKSALKQKTSLFSRARSLRFDVLTKGPSGETTTTKATTSVVNKDDSQLSSSPFPDLCAFLGDPLRLDNSTATPTDRKISLTRVRTSGTDSMVHLTKDDVHCALTSSTPQPLCVQKYFETLSDFALSTEQKLELAYKLASSLFYLYSTPWLPGEIDSKAIYLVHSDSPTTTITPLLPNITRAHDRSQVRETESDRLPSAVSTTVALGRLLVELYFGASWSDIRDTLLSIDEAELSSLDADIMTFTHINNWIANPQIAVENQPFRKEGNSYITAVRNCFTYAFERGHGLDSLLDPAFRTGLYQRILRPLQFALQDYRMGQARLFGPERTARRYETTNLTSLNASTDPFKLFEDDEIQGDKALKSKAADGWFEDYEKVLALVRRLRPARPRNPDDRIRVAILDTGVDVNHIDLHRLGLSKQIIFENFVPGGSPSPLYRDDNGHGTHVTSIFFKVVENVDVFVCRVSPDGVDFTSDQVAKAIRWAVHDKHVHVISISFGFPHADQSLEPIRQAILDANAADVLIFAAAGNTGKGKPMSFPACMDEVISISSTDGKHQPSDFNPALRPGKRLCTIGEAIHAAWIREDINTDVNTSSKSKKPHSSAKRKAGTSYSTPVAAGVAAMILDLMWPLRHQSVHECQTLRTRRGMLAVFGLMLESESKGGAQWLVPRRLIEDRSLSAPEPSTQQSKEVPDMRSLPFVGTILRTLRLL